MEIDEIIYNRKYIQNLTDEKIRLYYTNVKSSSISVKPIATLCVVHGFGHHSGEFLEFMTVMARNGIQCHAIDLRGHGYSGGARFDWIVEDFHSDIISLIKVAESENQLPVFIMGHSMGGGLISSLFIKNQYLQVNGIILSAPLLGSPLTVEKNEFKSFLLGKIGNEIRVK